MLSRPGRRLCAARSGLTGSYCVLRLFDHLLSMLQTARLCKVIINFKSLAFKGHGPLSIPYVGIMIRSLISVRTKTLFGHATNNCQFASQIVRGMSLYIVMESSAILPQMGVGYTASNAQCVRRGQTSFVRFQCLISAQKLFTNFVYSFTRLLAEKKSSPNFLTFHQFRLLVYPFTGLKKKF